MLRGLFIACVAITLVGHGAAPAQTVVQSDGPDATGQSATSAGTGYHGWLIGFGVFAGNGLESGSELAAGMGVQVGHMFTPTLAWMADGHGASVGRADIDADDVSSTVLTQAVIAAAVQWWPSRRVWLRGGIGPGRVMGATASVGVLPSAEVEETKNGLGSTVAAGFELYRGRLFALDLHARYSGIRADGKGYSSIVAGLGFGWYPNSESVEGGVTEPKVSMWHDRWVLGLGVLAGLPINNDCSDCYWDAGAGASFQVGWMLTPRLALMMDTHAAAVGESNLEHPGAEANALVQGVVVLGAQYWTSPRIWVKGGIGHGEVRASATIPSDNGMSVDITETESGFGSLAAVGYEFYQGDSLRLNVNAQYAGIHGDQLNRANLVLGVGMAWYP
jgi:hypothetical protein